MKINIILDRIAARSKEVGIKERSLSLKAGSADIIRNWRRKASDGVDPKMRFETLRLIAAALDVSVEWLRGETDDPAPNTTSTSQTTQQGFAEGVTPFQFSATKKQPDDDPTTALLRGIYGQSTRPAAVMIHRDLPSHGIRAGDLAVVDLNKAPEIGQLAVVTHFDTDHGISTSQLMLVATPWLIGDQPDHQRTMLRADAADITVRYPVIGIIRGVEAQSED